MEDARDVVIIGGGYGGLITALNSARNGLKVTVIEKRGTMGGTCLHEGCIPSKCLLNSSHKYYEAKNEMAKYGVNVEGVKHDFSKMMQFKDDLLKTMSGNIDKYCGSLGIDLVWGTGFVQNKNEVLVTDAKGEKKVIKAKNIVLNMGSFPAQLPGNVLPMDGKRVISSNEALGLKEPPKTLIIVGGGFIGIELGCHYNRLGSKVIVVEFLDRILGPFDAEIAIAQQEILKKQGLNFYTSYKVTGGVVSENDVEITMEHVQTKEIQKIKGDLVLCATGRYPLTKNMGLEAVGVQTDRFGRVIVNQRLQSSVPNIYAVGDVTDKVPAMAHKAEDEALALVDQLIGKNTHLNYGNIPSVLYTHPEVACVGLTEEQLKAQNVEYKKGTQAFAGNPRARCNQDTEGFIKFLADKKTNKILGVHMIGSCVGEMIGEAVLAIEYGTTVELIGRTSHAHPSYGEAFKDAAINCWKAN